MSLTDADELLVPPDFELVLAREDVGVGRGARARAPYEVVNGDVRALVAVLEAVGSERRVDRIVARLAPKMPAPTSRAMLEQLLVAGWISLAAGPVEAPAELPLVGLFGAGELSDAIERRLVAKGRARVLHVRPPRGAHAEPAASSGASRSPSPSPDSVLRFPAPTADGFVEPIALTPELERVAVLVIALEGVRYQSLDVLGAECVALGIPCLFATVERGVVFVGPSAIAESGVGFGVARRALLEKLEPTVDFAASLGAFEVGALPSDAEGRALAERASVEVEGELSRLLDPNRAPALLSALLTCDRSGSTLHAVAPRSPQNRAGAPEAATASAAEPRSVAPGPARRELGLELDVLAARGANLTERGERPRSTRVRTVGIVGGGTAGYLTALALRAQLPELEVTLIESASIPVIGVGEATTALLTHFLHAYLGLDIVDFYRRVEPTWKLGIRFEWGLPGDYFFNSPFQFGKLLESLVYQGDINENCVASWMMSANTTPVVATRDGSYRCLLSEIPYAYHLDNRRFVRYLAEEARGAGVKHLDAVISAAVPSTDRRDIDHLRTEDGRELGYDLYIDCSGFRSLLLEKALGSEYLSYQSSLFTDSAVMANVPHDGLIRPYTVAETMDHGWCWNIPTPEDDHRGYVFSSAFASVEQATAEMRKKNPRMGDTWSLKFRSGRHSEFWRGNCVAIGNSFAFVEPLQSTAIHMVVVEIKKLIGSFPRQTGLHGFQPLVSREVNEVWDTLRWFLAAHYRYNRRVDSAFWRECRKSVDVAGIEELVALYRERAPIGATAQRFKELDLSTFGVYRYDLLFMGMGLEGQLAEPDDDVATWKRAVRAAERLAKRGLSQAAALRALAERPELLRRHAADLAAT